MRHFILPLFFLSGALGLVYEVSWTRLMTHILGSTAVAVGTVLAAFMAGLAAGSWLLGRAADRSRRPLRLYAWLELGVGFASFAAHVLLKQITPVYLSVFELLGGSAPALGIARFLLAFVLVMAPTTLMGATLPILARFYLRRLAAAGSSLGGLYAINTAGAVAGALAAGFFLIGRLGVDATVHLAALGNIAVGVVAWLLSARIGGAPPESAPAPAPLAAATPGRPFEDALPPGVRRAVLIGLAISGLTSFAYEIYWTRGLVFLMGNSTYAVTTTLMAFLTGIALGGFLIRFLVDRSGDRAALFGWIQLLIGWTALAAMPVLFAVVEADALRLQLGSATGQAGRLFFLRFGLALLVMLVPATFIGATFPLVGRIGLSDLRRTGSDVGRIYAVNTLGNVAGALLPGLVLLHWLGIQQGILMMATLNLLVGGLVLLLRAPHVRSLRWAMPCALGGSAALFAILPSGFRFPSETQEPWHRVLFYDEGPSATTAVILEPDTRERSMSVDGVDIGGTGFTDFKQQLLAHLPKLLLEEVSTELSIGLGSGILVGQSVRHDRVRSLVCVEIEPSVLEGAALFERENRGVLADPRLNVVVDDVAHYLRTTSRSFHVVSADEKTSQQYASNGFSYSLEYYQLLREHLAPGGLVIQWVPTTLPPSQYSMVLKTFSEAFPRMQLWYFAAALQAGTANTILVGSNEEVEIDSARIQRAFDSVGESFQGLVRYGIDSAESLLLQFVADEKAVRVAVQDSPVNTLDHPRYEFYSPADYAVPRTQRLARNLQLLSRLRESSEPAIAAWLAASPQADSRVGVGLAAERKMLEAQGRALAGAPWSEVYELLAPAIEEGSWNESLRARAFVLLWERTAPSTHRGDFRAAALQMRRTLALCDRNALSQVEHGLVLTRLGRIDEAVAAGRAAAALDPGLVAARRLLARALLRAGERDEATEHLQALLSIEPGDAEARRLLAGL